ncbi:MAG: Na(+)/H(+) antiporter subunit D [Planctomycetes bacterium]|nr:Na(+)/H(+) antiporter subunit D [Planctomycetota bacterium]HPF13781.1 Na(+)/H(+) antiporter subunit D [Planctomycetota bacterium]HRV79893.1 Na(+)/H(+) antiporter subunit D [Planctomycetota bacterium]
MIPIPPFALFFLGALLVALVPKGLRAAVMLLVPALGLANLVAFPSDVAMHADLCGYQLTLFQADKLSFLFLVLFHIAAFLGGLFAAHLPHRGQHVAALVYAGSALGAVGAGDLISLFLFWEVMAVSSAFLIWARKTDRSWRAGNRYLLWQILSGLLLLAGIGWHASATGSIQLESFGLNSPGGLLIFLGIGTKACFPLLHTWLVDGYPEATPTGAVWLCAFTTKAAVYALARMFPGEEALILLGAAMAAFPIFFAVIENDMRRVLGYSMINQIGFMLVGIGIGTDLAINGAVAHAFNDVLFKGLLFMTMGAVLQQTGRIHASDLGGLIRSMPWTGRFCLVGAASISAFPLFGGFVSKSMIMAAALEQHLDWVWFVLLFAAAGVFHHAGIKIPFFAFFGHDAKIEAKDPPRNQLLAMGLAAAACIVIGSFPHQTLYRLLPLPNEYSPYDMTHVLSQLQLLFFSALAFTWLQRSGLYPPELHSTNLDSDWILRRPLRRLWTGLGTTLVEPVHDLRIALVGNIKRADQYMRTHAGPYGVMTKTWPTGIMMIWVALLLVGYLVLYYVQ